MRLNEAPNLDKTVVTNKFVDGRRVIFEYAPGKPIDLMALGPVLLKLVNAVKSRE